jgi:hypothetical protein
VSSLERGEAEFSEWFHYSCGISDDVTVLVKCYGDKAKTCELCKNWKFWIVVCCLA